jgi:hypothetical protein
MPDALIQSAEKKEITAKPSQKDETTLRATAIGDVPNSCDFR